MMSTWLRGVLGSLARGVVSVDPTKGSDRIRARIARAEVVSFDVFDTLLSRDVLDPTDVFSLAQLRYERAYGSLGFDLRSARMDAERMAYAESGGHEVTLKQIYSHVGVTEQTAHALQEFEIATEVVLVHANVAVRPLYDYAMSLGKRIIVVSDMYLPKDTVEGMLSRAGYFGYERLYLSSEVGLKKRDGGLFHHVVAQEGVAARSMLHIGDSLGADWLQARRAGMDAVLIPRITYRARHEMKYGKGDSDLTKSVLTAVTRNLSNEQGYYYRFGVEALGPLLVGLAEHLREGMRSRGLSNIYFMARDGYVLKKAYEVLYPSESERCRYLYASRRSTGVPSIYSKEDFAEVCPTTRRIPVTTLLEAAGVGVTRASEIAQLAGYEEGERLTKLESLGDAKFDTLCRIGFEEVRAVAADQRALLIDYIKQEGLSTNSAVFDLGWAGNVQGFLNRVVRHELGLPGFFGFYLGLDETKRRHDISCDSYLGNRHPSLYLELVELCFSSGEGSVRGFTRSEGGAIAPILASYEYEGLPEAGWVEELQRGALDFVGRIRPLLQFGIRYVGPNTAFSVVEAVGTRPNREDVAAFAKFRFEDNGAYTKLADPESFRFYALHPRRFLTDFAEAKWKVAFAKTLLKLPLPYHRILSIVKTRRAKSRARNAGLGGLPTT